MKKLAEDSLGGKFLDMFDHVLDGASSSGDGAEVYKKPTKMLR